MSKKAKSAILLRTCTTGAVDVGTRRAANLVNFQIDVLSIIKDGYVNADPIIKAGPSLPTGKPEPIVIPAETNSCVWVNGTGSLASFFLITYEIPFTEGSSNLIKF